MADSGKNPRAALSRTTGALIRAARGGDHTAFEGLVHGRSARLYRIALRVTADAALAEDVVQEAFLRVLRGRSAPRRDRSADAWLRRVVTNLALDTVRRRTVRQHRETDMAERRDVVRPDDRAIANELAAAISRALGELPTAMRTALWLHLAEGMGVREVASCLETSKSSVSRLVRDGQARLRGRLRGWGMTLPVGTSVALLLQELRAAPVPASLAARLEELWTSGSTAADTTVSASTGWSGVGMVAGLVVGLAALFGGGGLVLELIDNAEREGAGGRRGSVVRDDGGGDEAGATVAKDAGPEGDRNSLQVDSGGASAGERGDSTARDLPPSPAVRTEVDIGGRIFLAGVPQRRARVSLRRTAFALSPVSISGEDFTRSEAETRSRSDGSFVFERVPLGSYTVVAQTRRAIGALGPIVVRTGDGDVRGLELTLAAARPIHGRVVVPEGAEVPTGAEIMYWSVDRELPAPVRYRLPVERDGSFAGGLSKRGGYDPDFFFIHVPGFHVEEVQRGDDGGLLVFRLAPGHQIAGILLDGAGAPVPEASVRAFACRERPRRGRLVERVRTGADGSFRLSSLPAGEIALLFTAGEYPTPAPVFVDVGDEPVRLEALHLERGRPVAGVVTAGGRPLPGCVVYASLVDGAGPSGVELFDSEMLRRTTHGLFAVRTNARGEFTTPALAAGQQVRLSTRLVDVLRQRGDPRPLRAGAEAEAGGAAVTLDRDGQTLLRGVVVRTNGDTVAFAAIGFGSESVFRADQIGRFEFDPSWVTGGKGDVPPDLGLVARDANGREGAVLLGEALASGEDFRIVLDSMARIEGRVTTSHGSPAVGVTVKLQAERSADLSAPPIRPWTVETQRDGRFRVFLPDPERRYTLVVKKEGYVVVRREHVDPGATVAVVLRKAGSLRVHVTTPEGEPVEQARLTFHDAGGKQLYDLAVRREGDGFYAVPGLPPGDVRVQASRSYREGEWSSLPVDVAVVAEKNREVEIALSKQTTLLGRVVDRATGEPIAGARLTTHHPDSPAEADDVHATTDHKGRFELPGFPRGSFLVYIQAAGYRGGMPKVTFSGESDEEAEFRLRKSVSQDARATGSGSLFGRVVDGSGHPVTRARVEAVEVQAESRGRQRRRPTTRTGDDGEYRIEGLASGRYRVDVTTDGPHELPRPLEVDVGQGERRLDVTLRTIPTEPFRVSGDVVDEDGQPVAGANVRVSGLWPVGGHTELRRFGSLRDAVEADANGRYVIAGDREAGAIDRIDVHAYLATEFVRYVQAKGRFDYDGNPIRVVLSRRDCCRVRLHVRKADGTPASNCAVYLFGPRGNGGGKRCDNPEGIIERTFCGEVDALIATGVRPDIWAHFACETAGETIEMTLEPQPPGRIEGVILDAEGQPVPGLELGLGVGGSSLKFFGMSELAAKTDNAGRFAIDHVPPGEHAIRAGGQREYVERDLGRHGVESERTTTVRLEWPAEED